MDRLEIRFIIQGDVSSDYRTYAAFIFCRITEHIGCERIKRPASPGDGRTHVTTAAATFMVTNYASLFFSGTLADSTAASQ